MVRIYVSSVIEANAGSVWNRIRDFNGLPQWHPLIADSRIENQQPADKVGCIRSFHTREGGRIQKDCLDFQITNTHVRTKLLKALWE